MRFQTNRLPCVIVFLTIVSFLSSSVKPEHPSLTINEENIREDQRVTLTCSSSNGNPPPQYTWYRNDTLLPYDSFPLSLSRRRRSWLSSALLSVRWINKCLWQGIIQCIHSSPADLTAKSNMNVKFPIKHLPYHFVSRNIYMWNVSMSVVQGDKTFIWLLSRAQ